MYIVNVGARSLDTRDAGEGYDFDEAVLNIGRVHVIIGQSQFMRMFASKRNNTMGSMDLSCLAIIILD